MYKILIVDDEEIEREGMAQFIDWASFGVELYRNGTERSGGSGNDSDGAAGYCADGH